MDWKEMMSSELGYEPITTFWEDFSNAEGFGHDAVRNTYDRAMKEWHSDYKFLTELVIVLNHKIWDWYQIDDSLARVYDELWRKAAEFAETNLTEKELEYYYKTID